MRLMSFGELIVGSVQHFELERQRRVISYS